MRLNELEREKKELEIQLEQSLDAIRKIKTENEAKLLGCSDDEKEAYNLLSYLYETRFDRVADRFLASIDEAMGYLMSSIESTGATTGNLSPLDFKENIEGMIIKNQVFDEKNAKRMAAWIFDYLKEKRIPSSWENIKKPLSSFLDVFLRLPHRCGVTLDELFINVWAKIDPKKQGIVRDEQRLAIEELVEKYSYEEDNKVEDPKLAERIKYRLMIRGDTEEDRADPVAAKLGRNLKFFNATHMWEEFTEEFATYSRLHMKGFVAMAHNIGSSSHVIIYSPYSEFMVGGLKQELKKLEDEIKKEKERGGGISRMYG